MPFKSASQARFMFARHPEIAEKWEGEGEAGWKGLPEKVGMTTQKPKAAGMLTRKKKKKEAY